MKTIHAIYENGVFRPQEKVTLPEHAEVEFEPRLVGPAPGSMPWLRGFGKLADLRDESQRIQTEIEAEFEKIDTEDRE